MKSSSSCASAAYDFADISSNSGGPQNVEDSQGQESILSDVPTQTSYRSGGSSMSQHDRELRSLPMAMTSRFFFFVGCAMFLWLSIDDLYWADETRTIPQSVLEADDDLTWRQFRNGQKDEKTVDDNTQAAGSGNAGYTRPSTMGTEEEEDELSWSELKDKYGNGQGRYLRVNDSSNGQQQSRRKEQEAGVTFLTPWEELPFSKQISASVLGHDATSWNSGQPVFTDTMSWDQLTTEQQEAAVSLGYDQALWDTLRGFGSNSAFVGASNEVDPAADQDWGAFFWVELPEEIRVEAAKLGYDEQKWNNGERTYADDLFWDELTPEQQRAAQFLGYTQNDWDVYADETSSTTTYVNPAGSQTTNANPSSGSSTVGSEAASTSTGTFTGASSTTSTTSGSGASDQSATEPVPVNTENWRKYDWEDLPSEIRGSAIALGFTKSLWQSGAPVATDQYFWDELSDAQQRAATLLFGYTETTWNASNNKWQKISWDKLPSDVQSSAQTLGYNRDLWDAGAKIDMESYTWDELSGEQQQSAYVVFGLTEESWAGAALKDYDEDNVKNKGGGRGGGRGGADDDYVFSVGDEEGNNDTWISKYQIVYFVGSVCFIVVGVLDLIREMRSFHTLMVLAGVFSMLASVWVETNLATSNIFHCFSMHFFLFQSIAVLFYRPHLRKLLPGPCKNALWMGDISFIVGALMESILSYFYFKDDARENLRIARADSFAALLFFLTAAIYIAITPVAFIRNTRSKPYL